MRRASLALLLVAGLLLPLQSSGAGAETLNAEILGIPGGFVAAGNYGTPVAVMTQGASATLTNYDIALHDVLSVDTDANDQPLFNSELIGLQGSGPVNGVEDLEPGEYGFYCSLHAWMTGTLHVVADPAASDGGDDGGDEDGTWPFYGADLANSRSTTDGPSPDEVVNMASAWSYELTGGGDFQGTPVIGDGAVIMGSAIGRVVAVEADTGEERWQVDLRDGNETAEVTATVAYDDGVAYVPVSGKTGGRYTPYIVALDTDDGTELWRNYIDEEQPLGDIQGSPVIWETAVDDEPWRTLYVGTSSYDSGAVGEGHLHLGTIVALDLDNGGEMRWRTYMADGSPQTKADVPLQEDGNPINGAGVWSTPTIETDTGKMYFGTGQGYTVWHSLTNSLVRMDAFTGEIEANYQATRNDRWSINNPQNGPDADFGASAQLITGPDGERWLGAGQKGNHVIDETTGMMEPHAMVGIARYHVIDRDTMEPVWITPVGPGYWTGGITGSTAYDGERVYGSDVYGEMFSLHADDGLPAWIVPSGDEAHFAPTTHANGVVYSATTTATLTAWDAATGVPLFIAPIGGPSFGGVAVVGDTVYVAQGFSGPDGRIHAFRVP